MIKEIKIELTEQCQRWCTHCSSKAKATKFQYLDEKLVKKIIDEAKLLKVESIVFTGGEATLYRNLDELISITKEKGMQTKLYTMCDPTEESIYKIKNLVTYGLDEMIYSTNYHLTRDGIINLEILSNFFPKLLKETSVNLGFHHAITKETIQDIDDIIKLFFSLPQEQMTKLSFLRFVPHGRGTKELLLNKEELLEFKQKMIEYKTIYGDKIRLGSPWNFLGIEHTPCSAAESSMIIGFDGNVYPCDAMKYFDYLGTGGNIYNTSLTQIYNSKYFENIRNYKECIGEECIKCFNKTICKGGCLGQKMVDFIDNTNLTFKTYGEQAKRTMNKFESEEIKKMNGEMGIIGEIGELIDSFKKYKTHSLDTESLLKLRKNLEIETGDIIWYLAASLSSYYQFEFEDIGNYITKKTTKKTTSSKVIDNTILCSVRKKDPDCFYQKEETNLSISILDQVELENYQFETEWKQLVYYAYQIIFTKKQEEVLKYSAELLLSLSRIVKSELDISIEQVLQKNIEKLKQRYEKGFDPNIASSRVQLLSNYKESEPEKTHIKKKEI